MSAENPLYPSDSDAARGGLFSGPHLCLLHADHPDRPQWDALRLPTCQKRNLPTPEAVTLHMQRHHVREWRIVSERQGIEEKIAEVDAATPEHERRGFLRSIFGG